MPAAFVTFADNDSYSDKMDNRNGSTGTPTSDAGSRKSSEDRTKKLSVSSNASLDTLWEYYPRRLSEAGLRRHSDASQVLTEDTDSFIIGDRVWVGGTKPGQIAYIGETQFAPGEWAGIVLDDPIGKNDGSVSSVRYFQCEPRRGVFSRLMRLTRYPLESPPVIRENVALALSTPSSLRNSTASTRSKQISPSASVKTPSLSANKNLNTSNTSLASISNADLKIGDRVIVRSSATTGSKPGILRFIGATQFAPGEWCGVELDDPIGKNDGSVDGISYFECQPFYGLFTPIHKVSKSPSTRRPSSCVVHRPGSTTPGLRRSNSRESLTSMNTSIASSVRTTASRVRLGVTSLSTPKGLAKPNPASTPYASKTSLQESIREKDQQISKLLRERDLERTEIIRASTQADHAEQLLATLRKDYDKYRQECEIKLKENNGALCKLQSEREILLGQINEEKRKAEDLQFRFEEAALHKDDVESTANNYLSKIKELENNLKEERERVKELEKDGNKLFEAEEELTKTKVELEQLKAGKVDHESSSNDLKQENEELKKELEKLKTQNLELHSKVDNTETLYSKALLTINEQKEELVAMKEHLHKVKDELQMKTRDLCESNQKQVDDLQKENEKLQKELESQKSQLESYVHEIKKRDNELAEITVKLEQTKHENKLKDENIEHHIRAKRGVEEHLEKKVKEHQETLKQQQDEFEQHKIEQSKKLADAETEIVAKRATIESHASALAQLQKELSEANAQVQFATSQASMQQTQESFIQQKDLKILQMNAQFEAKCNELAHCHDINTKQVQELHQKEAQIETYKRDFEVLYQKLRDEETLNCNLTARINEMELNVGDLTRKITSQNEIIQIVTEEKHKLEIELQQYMTHNHEYDEKLMKCSNRNNELIRQLDECRNEYNKHQQVFQHKEHEYQLQIQNLQSNINNLNENLNRKLQDAVDGRTALEQKCHNDLLAAQRIEGELRAEIDRLNILLQQTNESTQKREQDYKLEIEQLKVEINKLTIECQNQIKMCDVKLQHIENENKELKNLLKQKNDMIIEMDSKCKQMFNDCQNQCHNMQEECGLNIKKINEELNHLRVTLSQRDQTINELNVRINSLKQENIEITSKLQVYQEENSHLQIEINQCKQSHQHMEEELNAKNSQLNIYMQQVKHLSEEKQKIEVMLQEVHKKLDIVTQECTQVKEQFILNRQHCANKDQQIKELEEIKIQYENQKSMFMVQIQQKESKIEELVQTIEITKQQQCVECENRIQMLQKQYDNRAMECSKMEQNMHMLQIKVNDMSIECNRAKSEITIWQQEYEKVKNQSNVIEQHCAEKDTLILDLRGELQILKEHHEKQSNHRIELLEQQINQYKIQFNEYQSQCDAKSHELEECKHQIIIIREKNNQENHQQVTLIKQQYDQLQNNYHSLQINCEKRQQEIFHCKQEVQQTQHQCSEKQNKLIILEKQCTEVQNNFASLKQRCENNIINLKICQEQLRNRVEHPPTHPPPTIIQQSCDTENRQIVLLQQQIKMLQRGVCDVNRICANLQQNDINVQRFCHEQIVEINKLQGNLEQCKNTLQVCQGHQQDSVQNTNKCTNEKHLILNQCNEQKRQLEIKITQLQQENLKFVVIQKELEQSKMIIRQLQQEGEHRCDLLKLTVQQKENEIIYLHDIIQQLHVINNSTSQNNKHCKMLELTIKQNQVELTQKIKLINELRLKIDGLLKLQNDVQRCSVMELQLQQKQLEIDTQAQLIVHLRKLLEDLQFGGNQHEHNLQTFRAEIDKLNKYLNEKDQMIFKLQTKVQQCDLNKKLNDQRSVHVVSESNCAAYIEEINRLKTELHWTHVHATEFQNKFHLLVTENQQLLEKLRQCVDGCQSHGSINVTIPNNWEIEKLTLLEQIAELKCELETRAKELIICKTKIPCKSKSTEIGVDLDLGTALEQARREKFTQINNKISGGASSQVIGVDKQKTDHVIQSRDDGSTTGGWQQITQANQQIQFLNSIIVDMQQKNEQLRSKIEALEATCAPNSSQMDDNLLKPRVIPPRMFCDICDEFDLHETEDCPNQDNDLMGGDITCRGESSPLKRHPPKNETATERPYCEICEAFGHSTEDCDETETF